MNNTFSTNEMRSTPVNHSRGSGCAAGLLLVLLGTAFFLHSQGLYIFPFNNWWALFILVPAFGSFDQAGQNFRNHGNHLGRSTGGSLLGGFILILVSFAFLFNLNWAVFGPLLIVLAGLGILMNSALPGQ